MDPEEPVMASYVVMVDRDATVKEYGLDSEIRYRDALDTAYVSDTMNVRIRVAEQPGVAAILSDPVLMSLVLAAGAGIAFAAYRTRRKNG
jgi:hypothetical protein